MLVAEVAVSSSNERKPSMSCILYLVSNDEFLTATLTDCLHIQNKIRSRLGLFVQNEFSEC
jgi:hypothetical protein